MLSLSRAGPAVWRHLMDGMTSRFRMASLISDQTLKGTTDSGNLPLKNSTYLPTVSSHLSLLFSSAFHRAYVLRCMRFW